MSKMSIDELLKHANENPRHRLVGGRVSFWHLWTYRRKGDATRAAASLRRRGLSATVRKIMRPSESFRGPDVEWYEVLYRDWGTGKRGRKPDWRRKTGSMVLAPPRGRGKR